MDRMKTWAVLFKVFLVCLITEGILFIWNKVSIIVKFGVEILQYIIVNSLISLVTLALLSAYLYHLNKSIEEKNQSKQLKVFEYISYFIILLYVYYIINSFIYYSANISGLFLSPINLISNLVNVCTVFCLFYSYKIRKEILGKFGAKKITDDNYALESVKSNEYNTITERLAVCKVCNNRSFKSDQGIVCSLTERKPNFTEFCNDFSEDEKQKARLAKKENQNKGFLGSWKAALLFSIFGFARAAMRGFQEPMGMVFLILGIGWLLIAIFDSSNKK